MVSESQVLGKLRRGEGWTVSQLTYPAASDIPKKPVEAGKATADKNAPIIDSKSWQSYWEKGHGNPILDVHF